MKRTNVLALSGSIRITFAALLVALVTSLAATAHGASITGQNGYIATLYGNPFTGSTNTVGAIGAGTVFQAWSISNAVSQTDGLQNAATDARIQSNDGATSGYMQFVATNPFTAGTVISNQFIHPSFNSPMSYNVLLDGNTVQSGAGTLGSSPIAVTTLPNTQTVQTLRLNMAMTPFGGPSGPTYSDMNEVLILPDRLAVVPSTASATGTSFGSPAGLNDLQGGTNYWGGGTGSSVTLTFSGAQWITALVLANLQTVPDSSTPVTFNILNDASLIVATGSLTENAAVGEFVGVKFNTPVITSSLTFNFTNAGGAGFVEIIPFVPEPSSLTLCSLASFGLFIRYRRRRTGPAKS